MKDLYAVILMTKGYVAIIDREDLRRVKKHKWRVSRGGGKRPALQKPYAKTTIKGKGVYLHRFVMNAKPGSHVDHLNHETLDCRKSNLEEVTPLENNARRRVRKNGRKQSLPKTEEGISAGDVAEVRELDGDRSLRHERVSEWSRDLDRAQGSFTATETYGQLDREAEGAPKSDCMASNEG